MIDWPKKTYNALYNDYARLKSHRFHLEIATYYYIFVLLESLTRLTSKATGLENRYGNINMIESNSNVCDQKRADREKTVIF